MERSFMDFTRPRSVNANNLLTSIRSNVLKHPGKTALVCNDLSRTWQAVWERTNRLANSLGDLGLNRGDRVAMVLKNGVEFSEIFIATAKAGLIKVSMNCNLKEFELAYQLNDCETAVVGVPDERWGEAVKALVVLKKDARLTVAWVIEFCKERLASFKAPKSVDFVEALPKTASGKIMKSSIKKRFRK